MAEVRFTKAAEDDIANIDDFSVSRFGVDTAETYMRGFNAAFAGFPTSRKAALCYPLSNRAFGV